MLIIRVWLLLLLVAISSCSGGGGGFASQPPVPTASKLELFDSLWNDFDRNYSFFDFAGGGSANPESKTPG